LKRTLQNKKIAHSYYVLAKAKLIQDSNIFSHHLHVYLPAVNSQGRYGRGKLRT
jgi:hypothetical protein